MTDEDFDPIPTASEQGIQQLTNANARLVGEVREAVESAARVKGDSKAQFEALQRVLVEIGETTLESSDTAKESREMMLDGMVAAQMFGRWEVVGEDDGAELAELKELPEGKGGENLRRSVALAIVKSVYTDPITKFEIEDQTEPDEVAGKFYDLRSVKGKKGERVCDWRIYREGAELYIAYKITSDTIQNLEEPTDFIESRLDEDDYYSELVEAANDLVSISYSGIGWLEDTVEYARLKMAGNTKQRKNCVKGLACGYSCIPKTRMCKKRLEGQFKSHAEWLLSQTPKREEKSEEKAFPTLLRFIPPELKQKLRFSEEQELAGGSVEVFSSFRAKQVTAFFSPEKIKELGFEGDFLSGYKKASFDSVDLTFYVNGEVTKATKSLSDSERAQGIKSTRLAIKMIREKTAEAPEGTIFSNNPVTNDGKGKGRTKLYERLGFGKLNLDNRYAGEGMMIGIVQGGKLRPIDAEGLAKLLLEQPLKSP